MLEATAVVAPTLLLAIALGRFRVCPPVLLLVAGMSVAPLPLAVADDLGVEGIGRDLLPVIITAALALA